MSWRTALAVLGGLLLPLPLVLLLLGALRPAPVPRGPAGERLSPVLDAEARRGLSTWRRACARTSDCEVPLGCLMDARAMAQYCTDSQCMTDAQCPRGQVCRSLATTQGGPLVRWCIALGVRQEAERCLKVPHDKQAACGPGLLCAGQEGWCARPCREGEVDGCPTGFFCAPVTPRPVCLPSCDARGCPEGQQCVRFGEGASACARVYGPSCQQSPCAEGRACQVHHVSSRPGTVWMECVQRCGEGLPACAPGLVCDGWQCKPPCDPQGPESCAEGYRCAQRRLDRPWVCQPDS